MLDAERWLYDLYQKRGGRRWLTICGGSWGDTGKGAIEAALLPYFEVCVRPSGGANTGRTAYIPTPQGLQKFIFHLVTCGWGFDKESIIGHHVLVDVPRLTTEIKALVELRGGTPTAPLRISELAPLCLPYYGWWEAYLEMMKGANAVGTTKRGIAPTIAAQVLRFGPRVGYLKHPDVLRRWVREAYAILEQPMKEVEAAARGTKDEFNLNDFAPDVVTERLLEKSEPILPFIQPVGRRLLELAKRNIPTLIGMTQGWGLHWRGTYPFNSSTQMSATAAPESLGVPCGYFGPVLQVEKLLPTRVGYGPFPTGLWSRKEAEAFPLEHPELFSDLSGCDLAARDRFLAEARGNLCDSQTFSPVLFAQYAQVLLNELGASTGRGREPGLPDLFVAACAAQSNGADAIVLTRVDVLSDLQMDFQLGVEYLLDEEIFLQPPDYPSPVELFERIRVQYETVPVNLLGEQLYGATVLPDCIERICKTYERVAGVPVGLVSTSAKGDEGKVFRPVGSQIPILT